MEAGGAGMKPHITMLNSASVSVLAEGDVFLPCKAAGNPKPSISWTKVSTGKIMTTNHYEPNKNIPTTESILMLF